MNNEFKEKLQLYKDGKMKQDEAKEIECEIDKFIAFNEYLKDEDEIFWEELKQQMPTGNGEENELAKHLKRKVNLKLLMMTAISVFFALIIMITLYFLTSKIAASLFGLDVKEAFVKREAINQLAQMFHPQYESYGSSVDKSPFAQQNIRVFLDNTVGNTIIDKTEIRVRYSFGKPVQSERATEAPPVLGIEDFSFLNGRESDPLTGFKPLENAPQGTKAKVLIEFNKALTPQQLKGYFINQISTVDAPVEFTPVVIIGSKFVIANPSYYEFRPVFPYDSNNSKQFEGYDIKQNQYKNLDDQAHTESLIGNLNLIKSNQRLLQIMYYKDMFEVIDINEIIKDVENNGVEYVGMYISADSKELLKLKGNSLIHCLRVENIVVW